MTVVGTAAVAAATPTSTPMTGASGSVAVVVGLDDGAHSPRAVVRVADVDRREAALRASPASSRLPRAGTSEGRQLRRWIAHCLAAQAIVETEELPRTSTDETAGLPGDVSDALGAGSVALAVLGSSAAARAFAGRLTADVEISPETARRLAAGHPVTTGRRVRHTVDGRPVNGGRPVTVTAADLPADLAPDLAGAPVGGVLTAPDFRGRSHEITLLDEPATPALRADAGVDRADGSSGRTAGALTSARARAFGRWLDGRRDALVHVRPGYEHPADPRQPDNTHRH